MPHYYLLPEIPTWAESLNNKTDEDIYIHSCSFDWLLANRPSYPDDSYIIPLGDKEAFEISKQQCTLRSNGWRFLSCLETTMNSIGKKHTLQQHSLSSKYLPKIVTSPPCIAKENKGSFSSGVSLVTTVEDMDAKKSTCIFQEIIKDKKEYSTIFLVVYGKIMQAHTTCFEFETDSYIWPHQQYMRSYTTNGKFTGIFEQFLCGYSGIANVNYKIRKDGSPCIFEFNVRLGGDSLNMPNNELTQMFKKYAHISNDRSFTQQFVLVCAPGRSGSTAIQSILNTIPGYDIRGECCGAIIHLLLFYKQIKNATYNQVPGRTNPFSYEDCMKREIKPCFYNTYKIDQVIEQIQNLIWIMYEQDTQVIGFKDIIYNDGRINLLNEFIELFPFTKVIIHTRENVDAQSQSGWWKHRCDAKEFLIKYNNDLYEYHNNHPEFTTLTKFESMFDDEHISHIFSFLRKTPDFEAIHSVIGSSKE